MNSNLLTLLSPKKLLTQSGLRRLSDIRQWSRLPEKRIGWNYPLDYSFIDRALEQVSEVPTKILDIGCGPGAIHGFIEAKYGIEVLGIDLQRWQDDYVDHVGNFLDADFRDRLGLYPASQDIIFSASSLEHQTLADHLTCIATAKSILRPGGTLAVTVAAAKSDSFLTEDPWQWNLSRVDLEKVYDMTFDCFSFETIESEYRGFPILVDGYERRFGSAFPTELPYLSVGALWTKPVES